MDKLYIVLMNRWGDPENHSYVIPVVYPSYQAAREAGDAEETWRGGKYGAEIIEASLAQ